METLRINKARVVVLISAGAEWKAVKNRLKPEVIVTPIGEMFQDYYGDKNLVFLHGGWGKIAAAASTQFAIDQFHPKLVLNLGTCGGFEGRIKKGTILMVTRTIVYDIVEQMSDPEGAIAHYATDLDLAWIPADESWAADERAIERGLMVSADRDILASDIPMLVEKYGAKAADWESAAIAWVAQRNGLRCLILRGVTDLVGPGGGEAYGNIELYRENTQKVMNQLIDCLPDLMNGIGDLRED